MSPSLTPCGKDGQQANKRARQWMKMNDKAYVDQQKSRRRFHQGELLLRLHFKLLFAVEAEFHRHGSTESMIPHQFNMKCWAGSTRTHVKGYSCVSGFSSHSVADLEVEDLW